jgi:hypothetical protein
VFHSNWQFIEQLNNHKQPKKNFYQRIQRFTVWYAQTQPKTCPFLPNPCWQRLGTACGVLSKSLESRCLDRTAPHTSSSATSSKPSHAREHEVSKMDHSRPRHTIRGRFYTDTHYVSFCVKKMSPVSWALLTEMRNRYPFIHTGSICV